MPTRREEALVLTLLVLAVVVASAEGAQWTAVGPDGGAINRLLAHPSRPELLVATTKSPPWDGLLGIDYVFVSTDGGESWERRPETDRRWRAVYSVGFDPWAPHRLWLCTSLGLFSSPDLGRSWTHLSDGRGLPNGACEVVTVDPVTPGLVWTAADGVVYVSHDEGASWVPLATQPELAPSLKELAADPLRAGHLVVADSHGAVAETLDNGATWTTLPLAGAAAGGLSSIHFSSAYPDRVWARSSQARVVRSGDGGRTWDEDDAGVPEDLTVNDLAVTGVTGHEEIVLATSFGAYLRREGEAFEPCSAEASRRWVALVAAAGDQVWVTLDRSWRLDGNSREVWRSGDSGGSWRKADDGLFATIVLDLAVDPRQGGALWAATDHGLWHRNGGTGGWRWVGPDPGGKVTSQVTVHPADPKVVYLIDHSEGGGSRGMISIDGGVTWDRLELCRPWGGWDLQWCETWYGRPVFDPRDPDRIVFSTSGGLSLCPAGRTPGYCQTESMTWRVAASTRDPRNPEHLLGWIGDTVLESRDDGQSWEVVQKLGGETREIRELVADPARPGTFLARVKGGVLVSRDNGLSWRNASSGLGIRCEMIGSTDAAGYRCWPTVGTLLPLWNGRAVVGFDDDTEDRFAWSRDGAASWMPLDGNRTGSRVTRLVWDPGSRALYAATAGGGVWRLDGLPGDPPRRPKGPRRPTGTD